MANQQPVGTRTATLLALAASGILVSTASGQIALTTAQIAKRVSPSVVVIQGKTDSGDEVLGSGFIVSDDGKIATALHVIRDLKTASVQLANGQGFDSIFVVATDEHRDLAIVKITPMAIAAKDLGQGWKLSADNFPLLTLGNSDSLTVGEPVVVVGSLSGLEGTVTAGILSSVRDTGEGYKVLQTDASVNPGNSGGPLVNSKGQAIGVVSFKLRSTEGLNFAIPINDIRGLLNNLHAPMTLQQMQRSLPPESTPADRGKSPTLQDTLTWLRENIPLGMVQSVFANNDGRFSGTYTTQAKAWGLESCTVTVGTEISQDRGSVFHETQTSQHSFRLGSLKGGYVVKIDNATLDNGFTFISGDRWIHMMSLTSNSQDIVRHVSISSMSTPPRTDRVAAFTLEFIDETVARRVYEAFLHAASLCRDKKEPF